MSKYKKYGRGWFNESYRHSLSRRGIKTSRRLSYARKETENDIQRLLTQAQKEAVESRRERVGFAKRRQYLKSDFYMGREIIYIKSGDTIFASLGGEFGYVTGGKTKEQALQRMKDMVKRHGLPSGTVTLNFAIEKKEHLKKYR